MSYSPEIAAELVESRRALVESRHAPLGHTFLQLASEQPPILRRSRSFAGYVPYNLRTEVGGHVMNPARAEVSGVASSFQCNSEAGKHAEEIQLTAADSDESLSTCPNIDSESSDFEDSGWQCEISNMTSSRGNSWSCNMSAADYLQGSVMNTTLVSEEHGEALFATFDSQTDSAQPPQLPNRKRARPLSLNQCLMAQETSPSAAPESVPASNQGPTAPLMPTLLMPVMQILMPVKPVGLVAGHQGLSTTTVTPPSNATIIDQTTDIESEQREASTDDPTEHEQYTTMMVRNLPTHISQRDFLHELDCSGFRGTYDFCYLPRDFDHPQNKGFAFVNFVSPIIAGLFVSRWHNQQRFGIEDQDPRLNVKAATLQGLEANRQKWCGGRFHRIRNPELRPFIRK